MNEVYTDTTETRRIMSELGFFCLGRSDVYHQTENRVVPGRSAWCDENVVFRKLLDVDISRVQLALFAAGLPWRVSLSQRGLTLFLDPV